MMLAIFVALLLGAEPVFHNFTSGAAATAAAQRALDEVLAFEEDVSSALAAGGYQDREAALRLVENRYLDFIRRYPRNAAVRNYLGGFYSDSGRAGDAYCQWRIGLRLDPGNPYLHNIIAEYFGHDAGRPDLAVAFVRRAIRLKPDEAVFFFNLATYYDVFRHAVVGEYGSLENVFRACLELYRRAVELEPGNYDYAMNYALTVSFSPMVWRIADPTPREEKIAAWRRCLELAPDQQARLYVESQIRRVSE